MRSTQQQARFAGFLYLLMGLSAPIGLLYVPGKLIVFGNATATAANLRVSGWLLRIGIASELFHQVIGVFLVLALYRLFKAVDETLAKQVVILGALVSVLPGTGAGTGATLLAVLTGRHLLGGTRQRGRSPNFV